MKTAAHSILGIAADADAGAIKRAFRKLAMSLHPDRNPAPDAAERFKAIRAAHDIMMAAFLNGEAEAEFSTEAEDAATAEPARGENLRRELELTLEEAAFGCRKTLTLSGAIPCATCEGSGEYGASRSNLCGDCHGSGRLRRGQELERCPACDGRGFITSRTCPDCGGSGRHAADRHLQVHVPPGVMAGSELRLAGQGGEAPAGGLPGHLILSIVLAQHPVFQPLERDLLCPVTLSIFRWLAGGNVDVPLLGGGHRKVKLSPARTLHPEPLRLKGLGLPNRTGLPSGDLVISWQPVLPASLTAEQIALLRAAERAK